jgi:hypothetical protein
MESCGLGRFCGMSWWEMVFWEYEWYGSGKWEVDVDMGCGIQAMTDGSLRLVKVTAL